MMRSVGSLAESGVHRREPPNSAGPGTFASDGLSHVSLASASDTLEVCVVWCNPIAVMCESVPAAEPKRTRAGRVARKSEEPGGKPIQTPAVDPRLRQLEEALCELDGVIGVRVVGGEDLRPAEVHLLVGTDSSSPEHLVNEVLAVSERQFGFKIAHDIVRIAQFDVDSRIVISGLASVPKHGAGQVRSLAEKQFGFKIAHDTVGGTHLDFDSQVAISGLNGTISTEMPEGRKEEPFVLSPVPDTPGKLAALVRAVSEAVPVESLQHQALLNELTDRFVASNDVQDRRLVDALGLLGVRMAQGARLRRDTDAGVAEARALGGTWSDIARAAGITPQAARRRWDPDARKQHSDYERTRKQKKKQA
jgi:hypothetical protein